MNGTVPVFDVDATLIALRGMLRVVESATQEKGKLVLLRAQTRDGIVDEKLVLGHSSHVQFWRENQPIFQKEVLSLPSSSAIGRLLLGSTLSTSTEEEWRTLRQVTTPLTRPSDKELKLWMTNATDWLLAEIAGTCGRSVPLYEICMSWAVRTISPIFGGILPDSQILDFLTLFRRSYLSLIVKAGSEDKNSLERSPEVNEVRKHMDELVRVAQIAKGTNHLMDRLQMARDCDLNGDILEKVLRSIVVGTFVIGVDNVGATLAWTLIHLAKSPSAARSISNDAPMGHPTQSSVAAVKESLRLTPVAALIERTTNQPCTIDNHQISAGTDVLFAPWLVHRNSENWDAPLEFRIGRFSDDEILDRSTYFPFGIGKRTCVGADLAIAQVSQAVSRICEEFEFHLASTCKPASLVPTFGINLAPRGVVEMSFHYGKRTPCHVPNVQA